jgi:endonuclease-3
MNKCIISSVISILQKGVNKFGPVLIDKLIKEYGKDPFIILVGCLLSLRAKDSVTINVCRELFSRAKTPIEIYKLSQGELEKIIYKSGFYKNKARVIKNISEILVNRYHSRVPDSYQELIKLKGVGPKTAGVVLGYAYDIPAICVDTHVHRISNRIGIIKTSTVKQTEQELSKVLNKKYWTGWNRLLVLFGQNICTPVSPKCSICKIFKFCKRVGVSRSR